MKRSLRVGVCIAALSAGAAGCLGEKNATAPRGEAGEAPGVVTVTTTGFGGVEKAVAAARGKVVLIDLWATWCGPCVRSFPELVEKHRKYGPEGLAVISVSLDGPKQGADVLAFLKKNKATFTNLHLPPDEAAEAGLEGKFGYRGSIPHAVLFNRAGERVWAGHPLDDDLTPMIEAELTK